MRPKAATSESPEAKPPQPTEADSQDSLCTRNPGRVPNLPRQEQLGGASLLPRVQAAIAGEAGALDALLTEIRPRLYALTMRVLGDPDDAEDAVQDAMVKVWRNLRRFEGRSSFSTWIHRIAVNAALDRRRRRPATQVADVADEHRSGERVAVETPERLYARAEAGAVVQRAIGRLSVVHGEAIRMFEIEGETYADIAATTRCPIGTVMSRLYHARRKLAHEIEGSATGEHDLQALRAA